MSFEWRNALNLRETKHLLEKEGVDYDDELEDKRVSELAGQYDLKSYRENLDTYLRACQVDSDQYSRIVGAVFKGESIEPPSWVTVICQAIEPNPTLSYWDGMRAFVQPFLEIARTKTLEAITSHEDADTTDGSLAAFLPGDDFEDVLMGICTPAMVALMNENGRFNAEDNSQFQVNSLIDSLEHEGYGELVFSKFPVLAKYIGSKILYEVKFRAKLWEDFNNDKEGLHRTKLLKKESSSVKTIKSLGDVHKNGNRVCELTLDTGEQLIYKPRSGKLNEAFKKLIEEFCAYLPNEVSFTIPNYFCPTEQKDHIWEEKVEHACCQKEDDIENYYKAIGALTALSYCLGASDIHHENLIASGSTPVLVDLETVLQPDTTSTMLSSSSRVDREIADSVLSIGILPLPKFSADKNSSASRNNEPQLLYDLSGLSDVSGTRIKGNNAKLIWDKGLPRVVEGVLSLGESTNLPMLRGQHIRPTYYHTHIIDAFRDGYKTLIKQNYILRQFLEAIVDEQVRVVLWETRYYNELIAMSYHPTYLQSGMDQERLFSLVWRRNDRDAQEFCEVAASEVWQLSACDVPFFSLGTNSVMVKDAEGSVVFETDKTPVEHVNARISRLSEEDMNKQVWLIRGALMQPEGSVDLPVSANPPLPSVSVTMRRTHANSVLTSFNNNAVKQAAAVGDRLATLQERYGDWLSIRPVGTAGWKIQKAGYEFYGGSSGIGLFLETIGRYVNSERWTSIQEDIRTSILRRCFEIEDIHLSDGDDVDIGAFSGISGCLFYLAQLYSWGNDEVLPGIDKLLSWMSQHRTRLTNGHFDIAYGASGIMKACIATWKSTSDPRARDLAILLADYLASRARTFRRGRVAWDASIERFPITGYSHGAAGIVASLAYCQKELEIGDSYSYLIKNGLRFESSTFNPLTGNWYDLRVGSGVPMTAWCHGAAGILLSRLELLSSGLSGEICSVAREHAVKSLKAVFKYTDSTVEVLNDDSLCHGTGGALWILRYAMSEGLLNEDEISFLLSLERRYMERVSAEGVVSGISGGLEVPDLMTGLSGIGMHFLQLGGLNVPKVLMMRLA